MAATFLFLIIETILWYMVSCRWDEMHNKDVRHWRWRKKDEPASVWEKPTETWSPPTWKMPMIHNWAQNYAQSWNNAVKQALLQPPYKPTKLWDSHSFSKPVYSFGEDDNGKFLYVQGSKKNTLDLNKNLIFPWSYAQGNREIGKYMHDTRGGYVSFNPYKKRPLVGRFRTVKRRKI